MSEQKGLMVLLAIDGSVHSEAAVKLTAGITWLAGTIAHVLAVVPERWLLLHLSLGGETHVGRNDGCCPSGRLRCRRTVCDAHF